MKPLAVSLETQVLEQLGLLLIPLIPSPKTWEGRMLVGPHYQKISTKKTKTNRRQKKALVIYYIKRGSVQWQFQCSQETSKLQIMASGSTSTFLLSPKLPTKGYPTATQTHSQEKNITGTGVLHPVASSSRSCIAWQCHYLSWCSNKDAISICNKSKRNWTARI